MTDFYFAIFYATEKESSFTKNSTERKDLQFDRGSLFYSTIRVVQGKSQ